MNENLPTSEIPLNPEVFRLAATLLAINRGCCSAIHHAVELKYGEDCGSHQEQYQDYFVDLFCPDHTLAYWWGTPTPAHQKQRFIALHLAAETCS